MHMLNLHIANHLDCRDVNSVFSELQSDSGSPVSPLRRNGQKLQVLNKRHFIAHRLAQPKKCDLFQF